MNNSHQSFKRKLFITNAKFCFANLNFERKNIEFRNISLLLETNMPDQSPTGDLSKTHQRPTYLIGDTSETNMPHWRPSYPIGDPHAYEESLEANVPVEFNHSSNTFIYIYLFLYSFLYTLFYLYWNNVKTLIRHLGL